MYILLSAIGRIKLVLYDFTPYSHEVLGANRNAKSCASSGATAWLWAQPTYNFFQ